MSEITKNEVMETTEAVEVTEKVGVLTKVKGFCSKHKTGLIVGLAAAGAAVIGIVKLMQNSDDDVDVYDEDFDEYVGDAEECEEAEEIEE